MDHVLTSQETHYVSATSPKGLWELTSITGLCYTPSSKSFRFYIRWNRLLLEHTICIGVRDRMWMIFQPKIPPPSKKNKTGSLAPRQIPRCHVEKPALRRAANRDASNMCSLRSYTVALVPVVAKCKYSRMTFVVCGSCRMSSQWSKCQPQGLTYLKGHVVLAVLTCMMNSSVKGT
jgi:hypothetical protein